MAQHLKNEPKVDAKDLGAIPPHIHRWLYYASIFLDEKPKPDVKPILKEDLNAEPKRSTLARSSSLWEV